MGDLEKASSANVDRIVNTYDLYGRKTNIVDVDKGSWSYVTNGFGEVISQTNGNAQTTTNTYDHGGRLVRQYDPSGTICWSYGTTAAAYNVGQLINVKQWPNSQLCTSTVTPTYQENYTYTSKSLVGSKSVLVGGNTYTTSTTFDTFGRPYELTYPSYGAIAGIVVRHHYSNGGLYKLTDNANNPYQEFKTLDNRGSVSSVAYGNGTLLTTTTQTVVAH